MAKKPLKGQVGEPINVKALTEDDGVRESGTSFTDELERIGARIPESATSTTGETGDASAVNAENGDAGPTDETGDAAAPEVASPAIAPSQVRTLNVHGHCGNCGNPHIAKYGEGKWKCVCGAGNL